MLSDILDSALLRPGRIDRNFDFPPPGPEARVSILRIHSRKVNHFYISTEKQDKQCKHPQDVYSEVSIYEHWLRRWVNVLVLKYVVSAQRLGCTLSVNGDNT